MLTTEYKAALAALVAAEADIKGLKDAIKALGADAALMGASMLPPPFGTAADIASLGVSLGRGDWGGAFWDAVGIIPIVGDGAKAAAKGTRAAKQLKAIKKAIAKGEQIIAKKKDDLAKLCKKNRVGKNKVRQAAKESDCEVCGREPRNGTIGVKNADGLGRVDGSFSAINPGPLSNNIADTFAGGKYQVVTLEKDTIMSRAGTANQPLGQFFDLDAPASVVQTLIDKAILPVWPGGAKSPIDTAFEVKIPSGTKVYVGEVGSQGGTFVGGTQQIVVPKPWTIDGVEVINSSPIK